VLDATGTDRAVPVALSKAANWALDLAANHVDRVCGTVLIGPTMAITETAATRAVQSMMDAPAPWLEPSRVPHVAMDPPQHWAKYNRAYWLQDYDDFLWFFMGQCFSEPHSTKHIEDGVGFGRETTGTVLVADSRAALPDADTLIARCARITSPVLLIHGDQDRVSPVRRSEVLAELTGGDLVVVEGGGHSPLARDPVTVNLLLHDFAKRLHPPAAARRTWPRCSRRPRRVLYLSSPIGLGHARRDVAIAAALRERQPDVEIDWLAQHPVTRVLEAAGGTRASGQPVPRQRVRASRERGGRA
jgi:pimeloyl-ACP methyl ester carboxylesterase